MICLREAPLFAGMLLDELGSFGLWAGTISCGIVPARPKQLHAATRAGRLHATGHGFI